jgi:hypothetical protein
MAHSFEDLCMHAAKEGSVLFNAENRADKPGAMLQFLAARGKDVLAARELLHNERAGEEFAAPHVRLHVQCLLLLPVPACAEYVNYKCVCLMGKPVLGIRDTMVRIRTSD